MVRLSLTAVFTALMISACASVSEPESPDTSPTSEPVQNQLTARNLKLGDCGLFVWTMPPERRFILFSDAVSDKAVWFDAGREQSLLMGDAQGEPTQGQYSIQSYEAEDGRRLDLSLAAGEDMEQGTRFPTGTLKVSGVDGWSRVRPVSAVTACQDQAS